MHDAWQAYRERPELISPTWSFTVDITTLVLRLIVSGVLGRYPKLTFIFGYLGETLPYLLWRLAARWKFMASNHHLECLPSQYIQENMLVTTSGMFYDPALLC